jgi:hypothetical protein
MKTASEHYETGRFFLDEYEKKLTLLETSKENLIEKEINYDSTFARIMTDHERAGKPKTALKDITKTDLTVIESKRDYLKAKNAVEVLEEQCKLLDKKFLLEKEAMRSATAINSFLPE